MRTNAAHVMIAVVCIMSAGGLSSAMGAQLDTTVNPDTNDSEFEMIYQLTLNIDYKEGGEVASTLRGVNDEISFSFSSPHNDVNALIDRLNSNILSDGSSAQISELTVHYKTVVTGRADSANVDYKVVLEGKLFNHNIGDRDSDNRQRVDLGWRGISVLEPVTIDGVEINLPISALRQYTPVYNVIENTEVDSLLSKPIMNGQGVLEQRLTNWHFLFDPTGINVDASGYGLDESLAGKVVSSFTMGESSFREGIIEPEITDVKLSADKDYAFEIVRPADSATLHIIGYAKLGMLEDLEIAGVTPTKVGGGTGDFPAAIVYGMAGMAAVGGVIFFVISSRQIKKEEGKGQTGIDPSRLTGYQTSASAGGYQTNRGEAQLTEAGEYSQHQNVYADSNQKSTNQNAIQSDATCGCAGSADMGSECDCVMQDSCLCDGTCDCASSLCKENTDAMR